MIKNEHEYGVTKSWAEKFSKAIASLHQNEEKKTNDPDGWQLLQDSYQSQLEVLQSEIVEYEALKAHDLESPLTLKTSDLTIDKAIVQILIQARIAAKISPKELAGVTGISEDKIKEYEDRNYQNASFIDVIEVAEALGIKLRSGVFVSYVDDLIKSQLARDVSTIKLAEKITCVKKN